MLFSRSVIQTTVGAIVGAALVAGGCGTASAQQLLAGSPSAGRVLWLRADDHVHRGPTQLVDGWNDLSGHGILLWNFLNGESQPEWLPVGIGGRPALQFDGNDWLWAVGMPTGSYTKAVVCQIDDFSFTNNVVSSVYHHALYFGGTAKARLFHSGDLVTSSVDAVVGKPMILVASYNAANGRAQLFLNKQLVGSTTTLNGNWDNSLLLGSFGFGYFMKGRIAEVSIYDHALDVAELGQLHDDLEARYFDPKVAGVRWSQRPRPGQIYQRDAMNQAVVNVSGAVTTPGLTTVTLAVSRDGAPWSTQTQTLVYGTNGEAPFTLSPSLDAGLHNHEIEVWVSDGLRRQLVSSVPAVTVGDVYVVHGQSNAQASDYYGEGLANQSQNQWIRTFGTASINGTTEFDLHWDLADGQAGLTHAAVGQWGLRLAEYLLARESMPIAIINGAVGGTSVTQHQRNDAQPLDQSTIYGRLLLRMVEAGVADRFKALLWYQGESDAYQPQVWSNGWLDLRSDWAEDYPAIERVYVVQIRNDCGGGGDVLKEIQRELPDLYSDTTVMSTTAVPAHDGCHYMYAGYRDLGEKLARLLLRDFYGSSDTREIDPPNPLSAKWLDLKHKRLEITFRDPNDKLYCQKGAAANFVMGDGVVGKITVVTGNKLTIDLAARSFSNLVSYRGHPFDGPWFRNSRGVGGLCFEGLLVQ